MGAVPNGANRVLVVEVRAEADVSLPILYYGLSEPFSIRPGERVDVEVPLELRKSATDSELVVEILQEQQPAVNLAVEEAQQATLRTRSVEPLPVLATAALVLTISSVGVVAMVDGLAFPAINILYLAPAYPALFLFICASLLSARFGASRALRSAQPGD